MPEETKREADLRIANALLSAAKQHELSSSALRGLIWSLIALERRARHQEQHQVELERKQQQQRKAAAAAKRPRQLESFWDKATQNLQEYQRVCGQTAGLNDYCQQNQLLSHFQAKGIDLLAPPPDDTLSVLGLPPIETPDPSDESDRENEPPVKKIST